MANDPVAADAAAQSTLLTVREAADYLRISERTLFSLREAGAIRATCINRRVLYRREELQRYIEQNTVGDEPE